MKISFTGKYKSLSNFECELSGLSIITGKNGKGKSQFLELFRSQRADDKPLEFKIEPAIDPRDIKIDGLDFLTPILMNRDSWQNAVNGLQTLMNRVRGTFWDFIDIVWKQEIDIDDLQPGDLLKIFQNTDNAIQFLDRVYYDLYNKLGAFSSHYNSEDPENHFLKHCEDLVSELRDLKNSIQIYHLAAERNGKNIRDLKYDDFGNLPIDPKLISRANLFSTNFQEILYNYYKQRHDNLYLQFLEQHFDDKRTSIPDDEFLANNPPPEIKINELFERHHIPYYIQSIDIRFFSRNVSYGFWFVNKFTNEEVAFEALSSGEKVIVGLILKVFNAYYFGNDLSFPKLLILDEPDAHLHPQMSKLLIDVLEESFIKEFGMNIIMTTHSPSTVAVAPEKALFVIENYPITTIKKTTKDEALKILTDSIPTLSIDYKNHRQIFVEGDNDRYFFQTLYNKYQLEAKLPHELYFIAFPSGIGNSGAVAKTIESLKEAGNKTCYGVVDWDTKNVSTDRIQVHGEGKRYSIENYLFDPIYLAALFIKDGGNHGVYKELGFSDSYDEHSIGGESAERLQEIADWMIGKIVTKYPQLQRETETTHVAYKNGIVLEYPTWLLTHSGHDLVTKLKTVFPSLNNPKIDDNTLYKKLTDLIAKCYPFVPKDTISMLEAISEK